MIHRQKLSKQKNSIKVKTQNQQNLVQSNSNETKAQKIKNAPYDSPGIHQNLLQTFRIPPPPSQKLRQNQDRHDPITHQAELPTPLGPDLKIRFHFREEVQFAS